jgi:hypothetical protein
MTMPGDGSVNRKPEKNTSLLSHAGTVVCGHAPPCECARQVNQDRIRPMTSPCCLHLLFE